MDAPCSFAPEESEGIIAYLLKKHAEAQLMPIELPFDNWQPGLSSWQGKSFPEALYSGPPHPAHGPL